MCDSVCWLVREHVSSCVRELVRWEFWDRICRKRLEITIRLQWSTSKKWHMANRMVTFLMTLYVTRCGGRRCTHDEGCVLRLLFLAFLFFFVNHR